MLALTLKHPWPWAICRLGKRIENRRWKPPASLVGRYFAIHGGAIPKGQYDLEDIWNEARALALWDGTVGPGVKKGDVLMAGLVAVARCDGFVTDSDDPWFEGPIGWLLSDLFELPRPIPIKGAQGLWPVPDEALAEIRRQYREARVQTEGA